MKKAKCIKGCFVEQCDDDGRTIGNEYFDIEESSIWDIEESTFRCIGGEIRLTHDDFGWLEISKETFKECFEVL